MKKRLLKISLIGLPILFVLSLFEVINIESYYEDQEFINAPIAYLQSVKTSVHLMELITTIIVIAFIIAVYLDNKKGGVTSAPPQ
jgi:hypothetical protein